MPLRQEQRRVHFSPPFNQIRFPTGLNVANITTIRNLPPEQNKTDQIVNARLRLSSARARFTGLRGKVPGALLRKIDRAAEVEEKLLAAVVEPVGKLRPRVIGLGGSFAPAGARREVA